MVGDIAGPPGLRALFALLPSFAKRHSADLVVANGENAQKGYGIGKEELEVILQAGAIGDHHEQPCLGAERAAELMIPGRLSLGACKLSSGLSEARDFST